MLGSSPATIHRPETQAAGIVDLAMLVNRDLMVIIRHFQGRGLPLEKQICSERTMTWSPRESNQMDNRSTPVRSELCDARTFRRNTQSLAESSFDSWIKFYRPDENSGNSLASYHHQRSHGMAHRLRGSERG